MKVTSIIATMMVAQVSASFLEVFQGAVLSVQNSFGKLFSDVVTDVKDTVDCTILAVEHILSLSEDATARFTKKCASAKKYTQSDSQLKNNFPVLEISIANNEEYLKKELPEEIDARINATLLKYLNGYNPHDKLEVVQKELAKETERLAEVSDLVRQQLDKLSKEIHLDFTNAERKGYKPSVDSILDELKVLEAIEQSIRNSSEANEIHRLVDDVLNKLHAIESSGAKQNDKVNGILRDLEKSSNRSYKHMRQQLEDWKAEEARHLNVIKAKMDEHEKLPKHLEYAKMENTFAIIERPKISLVPIEKEIVSKTGPLSSNNTVESIQPNIVTNTDSKFLTFITEQITSTPKIAIQPSLHATSPVQINDASSVITPVSISTSSYVNEIIVDVMTTLIPQRIKEPIFDPMPDTTFTEKTLHSMNLDARQSTIELLERRTTISAMTSESATSLLVTATDPTKSSTTIPEPTTSIPMTAPELTILATTLEPTTSLAKTAIESTTNDATNLESTNSLIVTAPKPPTRFAMTPEFTTDLSLMAPESTANLTATPEPSAYPSMTPTERDTNPTTLPEPNRDLPVTTTEPATSSAVNPEPTLVLVVTTPESTRNPGTNPELSTELQVISGRKINSVMMAKSTINIPVMDTAVTTSPTMTQDPNKSLPVTASRLISFATTPEPTTNPLMTSTESTTNLTTTRELKMHLPLNS
ncbi:unnamed protein product [Arctia plantaginis]|uniref:Uncharacterized protein n=1 Tax=Arctia plantaginis TaxID=874455 RepID=A0A8S1A4C4_ARCPL|nr:unnamed protein product [Arctia plantaginis]